MTCVAILIHETDVYTWLYNVNMYGQKIYDHPVLIDIFKMLTAVDKHK